MERRHTVHFTFIIVFWTTTRIDLHALMLQTHIRFPILYSPLCLRCSVSASTRTDVFWGKVHSRSGGLTVAVYEFPETGTAKKQWWKVTKTW